LVPVEIDPERSGALNDAALLTLSRRKMTAPDELPAVLHELVEAALSSLEANDATAWRIDDPGDLACLAAAGESTNARIAPHEPPGGWAALRRARSQGAVLEAPIRAGGTEWGLLRVERRADGCSWTREDERFLASLADLAAIAVATTRRLKAERHLPRERDPAATPSVEDMDTPDALTGLMRRGQFMERLRRVAEHRPNYAVLCIDCDRLHLINASLGHDTGDAVLAAVAQRLDLQVRVGDVFARLRSDEFAALVSGVSSVEPVVRLAERLIESVRAPLDINGRPIIQSVSIGIALPRTPDEDPEEVVRNANFAMHRVKDDSDVRWCLFDPSMGTESLLQLELDAEIRHALKHDEMEVHYQPIIDITQERLVGFEALVRWNHPERGLVFPSDFIGHAEKSGHILELGRWVLIESCRQLAAWRTLGGDAAELTISVNLSALQLKDRDLLTLIDQCLGEFDLPGSAVKLEITETALQSDPPAITTTLKALRQRGIAILIDDFGTGYSSLSHLHLYPIDGIKIDRSFVAGMATSRSSAAIVNAVLSLGQSMGLEIVAEGAETADTVALLGVRGCRLVQGYYFSLPLDAVQAEKLVRESQGEAGDSLAPIGKRSWA
jgi:diguanylate cyclase (GGDEF)-like protein